jgi:hypothetical protein
VREYFGLYFTSKRKSVPYHIGSRPDTKFTRHFHSVIYFVISAAVIISTFHLKG